MARPLRLDVPLVPQHVVVRGANREPCFSTDGDFASYLVDLSVAAHDSACAIHAYVLMTNHVHLLVTGQVGGAVSRLMQSVGRRYVPRFNASRGRTGTLFQARFRSSVVETERYLLTCMRYIELNPVRAGMVSSPFAYQWSSVHANAGVRRDDLVTIHEEFRRLGRDDHERTAAYRALLNEALDVPDVEMIRRQVNRDRVLGGSAFESAIANAYPARGNIGRHPRRCRGDAAPGGNKTRLRV